MSAGTPQEDVAALFTLEVIARWRERVRQGTVPNGVAVMLDAIESLLAENDRLEQRLVRLTAIANDYEKLMRCSGMTALARDIARQIAAEEGGDRE